MGSYRCFLFENLIFEDCVVYVEIRNIMNGEIILGQLGNLALKRLQKPHHA